MPASNESLVGDHAVAKTGSAITSVADEAMVAEREGFEPSIRFWRILTFQASAFDHSATAPHVLERGA